MQRGGPTDRRPQTFGPVLAGGDRKARVVSRLGSFRRDETGALLVFFAMCCAAIFVIAALSFDLGKRSSTQTEMQSFADHVALATAGELNGMPGAMARATTAANQLIADEVTFAEGDGILAGAEDFTLAFYDRLPTNESVWVAPLDVSLPENDAIARFVGIEAAPVQVQWSFARLLSVFSSAALPSENVAARATAGHSAMACDVTPVFFCMPDPEAGVDTDGIWDPANHIGDALQLQTTSGAASNWSPGSMGFIDVTGQVDTAGFCRDLSGTLLYNCLMTVAANRTQCLENGTLSLQDGEVPGITHRFFNARMEKYLPNFLFMQNNTSFPVPPIVTKAFEAGSTCAGRFGRPTNDAMGLPLDDCFGAGGCTGVSGDPNIGNGDWSQERLRYVDTNYSVDLATLGAVDAAEIVNILGIPYHIDDPFRPDDATNPRRAEYADYPIVSAGSSRWHYYNAEVAAAYAIQPDLAIAGGEVDVASLEFPALRDLLQVVDGDGNPVPREGTSLPHCTPEVLDERPISAGNRSLDPRRRAFVAAAVDCGSQPINGAATARAAWYVELFLLDVATGSLFGGDMTVNVEVISGGLQNDGQSLTNGTFRNLVQLFR